MVWFFIKHKASFLREAFLFYVIITFRSPFSTLQVFVESILRTYLSFADVPISSGCAGGRPQSMPCACPTVGWKACPTARASGPGPEWGYGFNAAVQVAAHPVGRAEKQFRLSAVAEVPHACMFEEGVHNACDADVTAVFPSGDEAADASYDEVYLHPGL